MSILRGAWRDWSVAVILVATFFVLNVLVLMGSGLALKLLVSLTGMFIGAVVAYAASYPFRMRFAESGAWRLLGIFLGLGLVFGIIYAGSALVGIPAYPTAESGNAGIFIYGLAFGFGIFVPRSLGLTLAPKGRPGEGWDPRVLAVTSGVMVGFFVLLFAFYVLIEYLGAPLIRYFAG